MPTLQIAVLVGSLRRDSHNRKLAEAVVTLAPSDVAFVWPRIDDLPLYNQDDDGSPADAVKRFKNEIAGSAGVIFVTPEYNRSVPGALKNAIDHASRPYGKSAWAGKPAGVMGGVSRRTWFQHGAAAPAVHPGISRHADARTARAVHSRQGWSVR